MVDLTNILGQGSPGQVVEAYYEANQEYRDYLGLSEIGDECKRVLWYKHHGVQPLPIRGRILRLFETGDDIEAKAIRGLTAVGYTVADNQREVSLTYRGVTLKGHIDGIITGLIESSKPHLWECKSANHKEFNRLQKIQSYEKWNPKYKAQIHAYMLALELTRCSIWVENKNDTSVYDERVKIDKEYIINLLQDVFEAISLPDPPERLCPTQAWYKVPWCGFRDVCWKP